MDSDFWSDAWQTGRIGFHSDAVHPALQAHIGALVSGPDACVLVPLCGKTRDLRWLSSQGHEVVGVEWVEQALRELFEQGEERPERHRVGPFEAWKEPGLCVLQGDMFSLKGDHLSRPPTAVWDRACLVAVAPQRRRELVDVVRRVLAPGGRILLNVFDYDQGEMNGPPFAVPEAEVRQLFAGCTLTLLECRDGRSIFDSNPDRNFSRFDILTWLIELP
jgi:thiopurine S-methyltransferase